MDRQEAFDNFMGFKIVATELCSHREPARRHKKKRIAKKWLKRFGYRLVPNNSVTVFKTGRVMYCHPSIYSKIMEQIKEMNGNGSIVQGSNETLG